MRYPICFIVLITPLLAARLASSFIDRAAPLESYEDALTGNANDKVSRSLEHSRHRRNSSKSRRLAVKQAKVLLRNAGQSVGLLNVTAERGNAVQPSQHREPRQNSLLMVKSYLARSLSVSSTLPHKGRLCLECKGIIDYPWLLQESAHPSLCGLALLIWVVALIWFLNSTAQDFFVPPLVYWSRRLNLRPEIAGATLVALGNGAPDLFAVGTAVHQEDLPLGLSELLGANMAVICVAGGAVFLAAHRKQQTDRQKAKRKAPLANDKFVNATETYKCDACPRDAASEFEVDAPESVSMLCYLVAVVCLAFIFLTGHVSTAKAFPMPLLYLLYLLVLVWSVHQGKKAEFVPMADVESADSLPGLGWPGPGSSIFAMLCWAVAWPTYAVRWILIPPADLRWDRQRRIVSALAPIGLTIFCCKTMHNTDDPGSSFVQSVGFISATVLSALILLASDDGPELPWFYPGLTLVSKISSILVLSAIADELTALIEAIGYLSSTPRLWLGSTFIAWGNSLGDLVTGLAMVRQGQARAAVTSIFAGPLFNCLVGSGVALILACEAQGGSLSLWKGGTAGKRALLVNSGFLGVATIFGAIAASALHGSRFAWLWPYCLFALYVVFLPSILFAEVNFTV